MGRKRLPTSFPLEDFHVAAVMIAAGMSFEKTRLRLRVTNTVLVRMMADPIWPALVERKRAALNELMRGDA